MIPENYGKLYLTIINIITKNMRNKFLNANEAFKLCNARLNYEGVDFDNTKALFNVGFT